MVTAGRSGIFLLVSLERVSNKREIEEGGLSSIVGGIVILLSAKEDGFSPT